MQKGRDVFNSQFRAGRLSVYLQSRVDGEAACGGVHAGHVLHIVDLLQLQLAPVVPERTQRSVSHTKARTRVALYACCVRLKSTAAQ